MVKNLVVKNYMRNTLNHCKGTLLGLALGDALGTTLEFQSPGSFKPINDLVGGGVFGLKPGQWTDDTSMALCLADSLINCETFDAYDQLERYLRWYRHGENSSTGRCFDIGNATREALLLFEETYQPYCGSTDAQSSGNGSIMRLAPIPLRYYTKPDDLIKYAAFSSRTTHASVLCVQTCEYMSAMIAAAIQGASKQDLLNPQYIIKRYPLLKKEVEPALWQVINGSYKTNQPPQIYGSGYVIKTLEAALWAFYHTSTFEKGALKVVNLGDDADSTGAVYGQIAGAFYGYSALPPAWLKKIYRALDIEVMAERLYYLAEKND